MTPEEAARVKAEARRVAGEAVAGPRARTTIGETMDRRGVPLLRVILAAAALAVTYIDATEPDRNVPLTYGTLSLYVLYSVVVYAAEILWTRALPRRAAHWLDLAWHTLLVSLSSGTNSLFFSFYYFDILVASFRYGGMEGLRVTGAATGLFALVGYATAPADVFELNRFLLRPVWLLVLGSMIAYWGGLEERLERRLALLEDITAPSNPRFGAHQAIAGALEKLRVFYDAEVSLLVVADAAESRHWLCEARRHAERLPAPEPCPPELAALLLSLPHPVGVVSDTGRFRGLAPRTLIRDTTTGRVLHEAPASLPVVQAALDAPALATVPLRYHHEAVGRLYVAARSRTFEISDLPFLSHAMHAVLRVADNVRLVDRLASEAAVHERQSLARGVHDTIVQPYIGLQLGLQAVLRRLRAGDTAVEGDLERLRALIDPEVARLREYIDELRTRAGGEEGVMPAVRELAGRFAAVTGIDVTVEGPDPLAIGDRLGAELVQMVAEGLSNVRRHTRSPRARVALDRVDGTVALSIDNDGSGVAAPAFAPRSLSDRAHALGGTLAVHRAADRTAVEIKVPL